LNDAADDVITDQPVFKNEHERLHYLTTAARSYDTENSYSTCNPPEDLEHVNLENSDPNLPKLITKAFSDAIGLCETSGGAQKHQRRVYWLVHKIANMWNWRNDGLRARAAVETGSEVLTDPVYRQSMYCLMADLARQADELGAAETWLSRCNPAPTVLDLDTEFRITKAGIAISREQWDQALELLGRSYEEMPPARPNSIPQMTLDRIICLENLGEQEAAEREMTRVLEEELDPRLPVLDHDFLAHWLDGSKRLKPVVRIWERLKSQRTEQLKKLTKAEGEKLLSESARQTRADSERRLAAAKDKTPAWPFLGFTSLFSKLNAARKLDAAISTFIDGRGGLSAGDKDYYNVVGLHNGRKVRVSLYLTTGIARVEFRTMHEKNYDVSFDMKYDRKGRHKYHPESRLDDDWNPGGYHREDHRVYFSRNVYVEYETDSFDGARKKRRRSELIQKISECIPGNLRERTNRFLRRSYMDIHFRGDVIYVSYIDHIFWRTHPVRAINRLLGLANDWIQIIEWTGDVV